MPLPPPVERSLRRLGENISLARRRRGWTQQALAERIEASSATVRRLEHGDPGIAVQHLARTLDVLGGMATLDSLLETSRDAVGQTLMDEKLPQRVRPSRSKAP